jgi:hypothetical protein
MTRRLRLFRYAWIACAWTASPIEAVVTPVITEPAFDAQSDERNPVHEYKYGGIFDVRLTVAGAGGDAVHQKPGFIVVQPPARPVTRGGLPGAATQLLESRP